MRMRCSPHDPVLRLSARSSASSRRAARGARQGACTACSSERRAAPIPATPVPCARRAARRPLAMPIPIPPRALPIAKRRRLPSPCPAQAWLPSSTVGPIPFAIGSLASLVAPYSPTLLPLAGVATCRTGQHPSPPPPPCPPAALPLSPPYPTQTPQLPPLPQCSLFKQQLRCRLAIGPDLPL